MRSAPAAARAVSQSATIQMLLIRPSVRVRMSMTRGRPADLSGAPGRPGCPAGPPADPPPEGDSHGSAGVDHAQHFTPGASRARCITRAPGDHVGHGQRVAVDRDGVGVQLPKAAAARHPGRRIGPQAQESLDVEGHHAMLGADGPTTTDRCAAGASSAR